MTASFQTLSNSSFANHLTTRQAYTPSATGTRVRHLQLVTQIVTSLESHYIKLSTYKQYECVGGKFKHTYTEIFFRKVAYTRRDVACLVQWTNFNLDIDSVVKYTTERVRSLILSLAEMERTSDRFGTLKTKTLLGVESNTIIV
jgi:hypothetical protein